MKIPKNVKIKYSRNLVVIDSPDTNIASEPEWEHVHPQETQNIFLSCPFLQENSDLSLVSCGLAGVCREPTFSRGKGTSEIPESESFKIQIVSVC